MSYITLKCKNCGSGISINPDSKTSTCTHCGSTFMMVDLLDEKDMTFSKSISKEDLQSKVDFAEALKRGETLLYQAEFTLAEQSFKKAIEINDKNYKGYWGVVKAKTCNLNKIPETPEYKEYIKLSIKYVDKDDEVYVKNELSKLELLEKEAAEKKKENEKKQHDAILKEKNRISNERFWGKITTALIVILTAVILVCIYMTKPFKPNDPDSKGKTYKVSSVEKLMEYAENKDFLSSTIIIEKDLDFENETWQPVGTKGKPFTGTFYGNNHTISNLKINVSSQSTHVYAGFFGYVKDAEIYGLSLKNTIISSTATLTSKTSHFVGFVCGYAENTDIKRCEIDSTCTLNISHQQQNEMCIGGIVGSTKNCELSYAYSNARITSSIVNITSVYNTTLRYYFGGIVGNNLNTMLTNCYSTSTITTNTHSFESSNIITYHGGVVAYNLTYDDSSNKISKCYFAGNITESVNAPEKEEYVAGIVGYGIDFSNTSNNFACYLPDTYVSNSNPLTLEGLRDYSPSKLTCIKYVPAVEILELIEQYFSSSVWENTTTLNPTLK